MLTHDVPSHLNRKLFLVEDEFIKPPVTGDVGGKYRYSKLDKVY